MTEYKLSNNPRLVFLGALVILFIYFLPFIILGENSYFTIWDCLDGPYVSLHTLLNSGKMFSFDSGYIIPNVMNGLPRSLFGNGFYITNISIYLFKPSTAYIVNFIIIHLIAFFSMYVLLKSHVLKQESQYAAAVACSLVFAVIPFYTIYGACTSYQPLLLFAFLNLLKEKNIRWTDYLIIIVLPFFASTVLLGTFAFCYLTAIVIIRMIMDKKVYKKYLFGLFLMGVSSFLYEFSLLYQVLLTKGFVSTRTEMVPSVFKIGSYPSFMYHTFIKMIFTTHYHTGRFYTFPTIIISCVAVSIVVAKKQFKNPIVFLVLSIVLVAMSATLYFPVSDILGAKINLIRAFHFDRFYFLLPTLWIVLLAYCIKELSFYSGLKLFTWIVVFTQFVAILALNKEFRNNCKLLAHRSIDRPTCKQYFAESLFKEVKQYINKPQKDYRVVSVGFVPTIAQYNGFYTLDGYQSAYDVKYKHEFRKIIAGELDKDDFFKKCFDLWGSKCYMLVSDLGIGPQLMFGLGGFCSKDANREISNPAFNYSVLKEMGGAYIISCVKINNYDPQALTFEKEFQDKDSYWNIYLYRVR